MSNTIARSRARTGLRPPTGGRAGSHGRTSSIGIRTGVKLGMLAAAASVACATTQPTVPADTTTASAATVAPNEGQPSPEPRRPTFAIPLPPGSALLNGVSVSQTQASPEQLRAATGRTENAEAVVSATAADRYYASDLSYQNAVDFMDRSLKTGGFGVPHRTTTKDGTFFSIRCPDGSPARVVVRNTNPTTLEVVTAKGAASEWIR